MNHRLAALTAVAAACAFSCLTALLLVSGCTRAVKTGDPQELIRAAWNNYRLGEYRGAVEKFSLVADTVPGTDPAHAMALYGLATTWNLRRPKDDPELAREYYHRLLDLSPDGPLAPWCDLALARMQHLVPVGEEPDYDAVRKAYLAIIDKHDGHVVAEEAAIYYHSTYVATLDKEDARKALDGIEEFIVKNPESGFRSAAYALAAFCCETLGDPVMRTRMELNSFETMEIDPFNPFADKAWRYWKLATVAEFEAGNFDLARKFYRMLIEEYPQDIRKYASRQALQRMDEIESRIRAELRAEGS